MKATLYALNGQVTAIAFEREASNFNGQPVHTVEAEKDAMAEAISQVAPDGVGSPWPPKGGVPVPTAPEAPAAKTPAKSVKGAKAAE